MKRKFFLLVIAIGLVFVQCTDCFAESQTGNVYEIDLGTVETECQQEMWHYSDGYWLLNAGTENEIKLTDKDLASAMGIIDYMKEDYVPLKIELPQNVIDCINQGYYIAFDPVTSTQALSDLFDVSSFYGYIEGDYLYLYAHPKLNLFGSKTFDDFVTGLNVTLPLVDYTYGYNLYSIYKSSKLVGEAKGAYYTTEKSRTIMPPNIHPYMIKNNTGILSSTYQISINNAKAVYPSSHYVGWGTFKDGGAVGCRFIYPFGVSFTAYKTASDDDSDNDEPYIPPTPPEEKEDETETVSSPWRIHRTQKNL
ncbi:MAG: hypothetical protein Q4E99_02410 [Bacillota bacterium]|nr:hypothetical protein [Bacillota bacterium]